MSEPVYVIFFSKFSPRCTEYLQHISSIPAFSKLATLICVDNKEIRQRVQASVTLPLSEVPCMVRIHPHTGYAEMFDTDRSFAISETYRASHESEPEPSLPSSLQSISNLSAPYPTSSSSSSPAVSNLSTAPNADASVTPIDASGEVMNQGISTYHAIASNSTSVNHLSDGLEQRAVKKTDGAGGNIVSRAMQMQKERETETTSSPAQRPYS